MGVRPLKERIAEVTAKRDKAQKRVDQCNEQIKRMEKQESEEARKQRTHALIVCGAELAALFGKVLDTDEVYAVVNFLREQRDLGTFTLGQKETQKEETTREQTREMDGTDEIFLNDFFSF